MSDSARKLLAELGRVLGMNPTDPFYISASFELLLALRPVVQRAASYEAMNEKITKMEEGWRRNP